LLVLAALGEVKPDPQCRARAAIIGMSVIGASRKTASTAPKNGAMGK